MKKKRWQRLMAVAISIFMLVSTLPLDAFAEESVQIPQSEGDPVLTPPGESIQLITGNEKTVIDETGNYENADLEYDASIVGIDVIGTNGTVTQNTAPVSGDACVIGDSSGNYLKLEDGALTNTTDVNDATEWTLTKSQYWTINSGSYYLVWTGNTLGVSETSTVWFCDSMIYVQSSGTRYTVGYGEDGWTLLTSNSGSAPSTGALGGSYTVTSDSTTITFTGKSAGSTSVTIGNTTYQIEVSDPAEEPLDADLAVTARYTSNRLSWTAQEGMVYTVEYSVDGAEYTKLDENVTTGSYIHDTNRVGTQYYYRLSANGQTSEPVQADCATGLDALKQTAVVSWGFEEEDKSFDGTRTETLAASGSEEAEALSAMTEGTVVFRSSSSVTSGMTAALGSNGTFWAGSNGSIFRIEVGGTLMANLTGGTIQDGYYHTAGLAYTSATKHWVQSANGSNINGNLTNASTFLSGSNATEWYVGGATGATGTNKPGNFNGQISFALITSEVLTDAELTKLTGDNPVVGDEEAVLGSSFFQMFATDNTAGSANCSNTWMFDGGNITAGRFADIGSARSYIYEFEEYIRWNQANASNNYSGRQRYVFNVGKTGQNLEASLALFDTRAEELNPRAVVYLVGSEDYSAGEAGIDAFKANLNEYIRKGLELRDGTGFVLIQTPVPVSGADNTNAQLYAEAVREVMNELGNEAKARVQLVDHTAADWSGDYFNANGSLNASGHLEMGRQICEKLLGSVSGYPDVYISSNYPDLTVEAAPVQHLSEAATVIAGSDSLSITAPAAAQDVAEWNCIVETDSFTLTTVKSGSSFTISDLPAGESYVLTMTAADNSVQLPVMAGVLADSQTGGIRKEELTEGQQIISGLVNSSDSLTWLFMGDSITHGALWLGGYDSITQIFEKYLKDDLGREDDIVINTAVSGATVGTTMTYIDERLENYEPDVVSIMLGTNDYTTNSESYKSGLRSVIDAALAKDSVKAVVLRVLIPSTTRNLGGVRTLALEVAEEYADNSKVIVIDQYEAFDELMSGTSYMKSFLLNSKDGSGLHPGPYGQLFMARLFIEGIGLSMDNTYIGSLAYSLGTAAETGNTEMSVVWEDNSVSLDVDALEELSGKTFFSVTLKAEDKDGNVYSVTGRDSLLTLANLPDGEYSVTAEAVLANENKLVTFNALKQGTVTLDSNFLTMVVNRTTVLTANVEGVSNADVTWTSSDPDVAAVDENGKVTAVNPGTAIITATYEGNTATCEITVRESLLKAGYDQGPTGLTEEQPFDSGTGDSYYFRIPSLITLDNGWLMAAADARYETYTDGGGLDTIVSISKDNGKTWEYSFPIYFPDSDGYVGRAATTIIDPAIIQGKDGTIYMIADVNPTGMTTLYATPGKGTGHIDVDGVERLALTSVYANSDSIPTEGDTDTYEYYVGEFEDGYAPVIDRVTEQPSGYAVDQWYNLYEMEDGQYVELLQKQVDASGNPTGIDIQQNVFYKDSELHVFRTGYMWLLTSKDNGETWSNTDITAQIKRDSETGLLVSPGRGTLLEDGTIVIPFYNHYDTESSSSVERASFIYSTDGVNWERTADVPATRGFSSESEIVELSDGTLRMFFRNGTGTICYADAVGSAENGYTWSDAVSTGIASRSSCNISAIMYSEKIDGKDAILVACPSNTAARTDGKIFVFLMDEEGGMELAYSYAIDSIGPNQYYEYSCLTELKDGTVGLLYEYNSGRMTYDSFKIEDIAAGAVINGVRTLTVPLYGELTDTIFGGFTPVYPEDFDDSIVSMDISTETVSGPYAQLGSDANYNGSMVALSGALYTFDRNGDGSYVIESVSSPGVYLNHLAGNAGYPGSATPGDINVVEGDDGFYLWINNSSSSTRPYTFLYFHSDAAKLRFDRSGYANSTITEANCLFEIYRPAQANEDTSASPIPGYVRITDIRDITNGGQYLIVANRNDGYYALYPSVDSGSMYAHAAKVVTDSEPTVNTTVNYTGLKEGTVTFTEDTAGYQYVIHVVAQNLVEVPVKVGETAVVVLPQESGFTLDADESIATVEITTASASELLEEGECVGSLGTDPSYNGDVVALSGALYTFNENDDGTYVIESVSSPGVYLNHQTAGYPGTKTSADISVQAGQGSSDGFNFYYVSNNVYRFLYFWSDATKLRFDAANYNSSNNTIADCLFEIYRPAQTGDDIDDSPIPGYVQITDVKDIEDGGRYLIVANRNGSYYALYPSAETDSYYSHVVKVDPDRELVYLKAGGVSVGTTDTMVDGVIYRIIVYDYTDPVFEWSDDYTSASAIFNRTDGGEPEILECVITDETTEVTCNQAGAVIYTATVKFNGKTFTDSKTVAIEATGHSYGTPTFKWAADYSSCVATVSCTVCGAISTFDCQVSSKNIAATATAAGKTVYTAIVTIDGVTYTDTVTVTVTVDGVTHTTTGTKANAGTDTKAIAAAGDGANNSGNQTNGAKTGDSASYILLCILACLSFAGFAVTTIRRRKRHS